MSHKEKNEAHIVLPPKGLPIDPELKTEIYFLPVPQGVFFLPPNQFSQELGQEKGREYQEGCI